MKKWIKGVLARLFPKPFHSWMAARGRATSHRYLRETGCRELAEKLRKSLGDVVIGGPFAGMKLGLMAFSEHVGPYLLGTYESELEETWAVVLPGEFDQVVDIGCKFGYYAVAMARQFPKAQVVTFDVDWWARKATSEMAAVNQVHNVQVESFCDEAWLSSKLSDNALVICDCEGFEDQLFRNVPPKMRSALLIIELHDSQVPGVKDRLLAAFRDSHHLSIVAPEHKRPTESLNEKLSFLSDRERSLALDELRGPQEWLVCWPKSGKNRNLYRG